MVDGNASRISERIIVVIGGGAVVIVALFGLLWIVFGDARTAAIVLSVGIFVLASVGSGMALMYLGTRRTIEHMATAFSVRPPVRQVIDGDYELHDDGDLVSVDDRLMVRQDQIDRTAAMVYRYLYPHTQPTRSAIQRATGVNSNGFIGAVQQRLLRAGRVQGGGQGREYQWVESDIDGK
jgi:hypothetical protein